MNNKNAGLLSCVQIFALLLLFAGLSPLALSNPSGGIVRGGIAEIAGQGTSEVTVTQGSSRALVDWEDFSIAAGERTSFVQPDVSSIIVNRVYGGSPSSILGRLTANGQVMLLNRNGILFGKGSRVDTAGFVAASSELDMEAFMSGSEQLRFSSGGNPDAEIVLEGLVTVREAGLAVFVAPHVRNSGVISAKLGRVALAGARGFSLDLYGDGLISFAPGDEVMQILRGHDGELLSALVEQDGEVLAAGGSVLLTASAARAVVNASVSLGGIVRADSAQARGGVITLSGSGAVLTDSGSELLAGGERGGTVHISGSQVSLGGLVDASAAGAGESGGSVTVESKGLLSLAGEVRSRSGLGSGGAVSYTSGRLLENTDGLSDVSGYLDGGSLRVSVSGQFASSGTYMADGVYGAGGRVDITANDIRLLSTRISARGNLMDGGLVRIGGEFQGGKAVDSGQDYYASFVGRWGEQPALGNSRQTFVNDGSSIDVSSVNSRGGTVVVWSDELTTFLGGINGLGGAGGGSAELSSAGVLRHAELANVELGSGTLLLDPKDITIGDSVTASSWAYAGIIGVGYANNDVDVTLEANDRFGISVALNADGDRLAVGALGDDGAGNSVAGSGAVYLFSFTDTSFGGGALVGTIGNGYTGGKNVNVALDANDFFGSSVALNAVGDRLAVGAYGDGGAGNSLVNSGAAYLFSFTDTSFGGGTLAATIGSGYTGSKDVNVALDANDFFGFSVALNAAGDRMAVGARYDDGAGNSLTNRGAVYLFSFTDTSFSGGTLVATIGSGYTGSKDVNVALDEDDFFGFSVALNAAGDRMAVGARSDDGAGNSLVNSGAVYLFSFTDTSFGGGALVGTIGNGYTGGRNVNVALDASDQFGISVALNAAGDLLAVGAYGGDGAGNSLADSGAVYLFSFTDTSFSGGALVGTIGKGYTGGKNVDIALDVNDNFGISVALNAAGDRMAVGARYDDGAGNGLGFSGAVYLFSFTDTSFGGGALVGTIGNGYTGGKDVNVALEVNDGFGPAVALNADGDRLAVGADGDGGAGNTVTGSGAVYLFSFTDTSFGGGALVGTIGSGYTGGKNVNVALDADDRFGSAVALNAAGDRLAVGARFDDGAGNSADGSGAVYLFSFTDTSFSGGTLAATIGSGYTGGKNVNVALDANDLFGVSVAMNAAGDRLVVGADIDDGTDNSVSNSGAAYLFSFTDTSFGGGTLAATIGSGYTGSKDVNVALEAYDRFGSAVALNAAGDRLAVGAWYDDGAGSSRANNGAVYLFSFTDASFGGGTLEATLGAGYTGGKNVNVALDAYDRFGSAVALNAAGDRLAVGAWDDDGAGNSLADSGAVYLFSFTDTSFSGGTLEATIGNGYTGGKNVNVALDASDFFGYSVAMNAAGDRLAVGVWYDDGAGNSLGNSGAVYLFSFTDTSFGGGTLAATIGNGYTSDKDVNLALDANDFFGTSVALNAAGDRLVVDALGDDGAGNSVAGSGAVYLFSFTDTSFGGGALEAAIGNGYTGGKNINVALDANDLFGASVALNAAGDRLAVGAFGDDGAGNSLADRGAVYLFSFTDTSFSGGTLEARIGTGYTGSKDVNVALDANDQFGISVALNAAGDRLAVGAYGDDGAGNSLAGSGVVYLFSFTDTSFSGGALVGTIGNGYTGARDVNVALDEDDFFGAAVALNAAGDRLAVGAWYDDGAGNSLVNSGVVYLFSFTDTSFSGGALVGTIGNGYTGARDVNVALDADDRFGISVALNAAGDLLAVGAFGDDGAGNSVSNSGVVYLFSFTDTSFGGGTLAATIGNGYTGARDVNLTLGEYDWFGTSVALNAAGDRLAVGAWYDDGAGNTVANSGAVYLFTAVTESTTYTGSYAYAGHADQGITVSAASLVAAIATGTDVVLQASNDITLMSDIVVSTSHTTIGSLTLQAGRSIFINADIATNSLVANTGSVTLIANDLLSNGVVDIHRDAGAAEISMAPGVSIDAGQGSVVIELRSGAGKTETASGDITLRDITARDILVVNSGPSDGSGIVLASGVLTATASGTDENNIVDSIVLAGDSFSNNAGAGALAVADNGRWLVWSGNPANDTRGGLVYAFKQYNAIYGTSSVLGSGTGFLYTVAPTLTVTLTGTVSKVYDGTTGASLAATNYAVTGAIDSDVVSVTETSGVYDDKNIGTGKTVTATLTGSDFTITDGAATVYGYTTPTSASGSVGTITAKTLTVSNAAAADKVYDGTTAATVTGDITNAIVGDDVSLAGTGSFADRHVGTAKAVTASYSLVGAAAGNYALTQPAGLTLTADITPRTLTVTDAVAADKVYDGTTAATVTGGTLAGVLGSDVVTLGGTTGNFADRHVGTAKAVTTDYTISGADADNYALTQPAGLVADITARTLTVSNAAAADKVYDGTTAATLTGGTLDGVLGSDVVTLVGTTGNFADRHVGTDKAVTASYSLAGADAGNYALTQPAGLVADITALSVTVDNAVAEDKVYDGTTTATVTGDITGTVAGDVVSLAGTFADSNVGMDKAVTLGLVGADAGNYILTQAEGLTATISGNQLAASDQLVARVLQRDTDTNLGSLDFSPEPSAWIAYSPYIAGLSDKKLCGGADCIEPLRVFYVFDDGDNIQLFD